MINAAMLCVPEFVPSPRRLPVRRSPRTYIATTEILDTQYRPIIRVAAPYEGHFKPTMVTGADGCLAGDLAEDLFGAPTLARTGTNGA